MEDLRDGLVRKAINRAAGFGRRRRESDTTNLHWIVAAGGYRSGSTLQYNLIGTYLEHLGRGRRIGLVEPDDVVTMIGSQQTGIGVAKCHHVVGGFRDFERPCAWADLMRQGSARAVMSERNQSDVRRSMCRKFSLADKDLESSVVWLENEANTARWRELGAFVQTYDELTTHPVRALKAIVVEFGLVWSRAAAVTAADDTSRANVRSSMTSIAPGTYDPVTLVHHDHIAPDQLDA